MEAFDWVAAKNTKDILRGICIFLDIRSQGDTGLRWKPALNLSIDPLSHAIYLYVVMK